MDDDYGQTSPVREKLKKMKEEQYSSRIGFRVTRKELERVGEELKRKERSD